MEEKCGYESSGPIYFIFNLLWQRIHVKTKALAPNSIDFQDSSRGLYGKWSVWHVTGPCGTQVLLYLLNHPADLPKEIITLQLSLSFCIYILMRFYFCLYIINDRNGIILGMLFIILLFTLCTFCPPLQHTYTHRVEMWYQNQIMHKMNYLARFICLFCICTNCCSKTSFHLTGRDRVTHEFNFVGSSLQLVSTLAPAVIHVSITWSIPGEQSWSETKVLIRQISRVTWSKKVSGNS